LKKRISSSRPGRGIAVCRFDVLNQRDEIVLTMNMTELLKCRETQVSLTDASSGAE
jgi:hypothetical protein